ncbi:MAG: OmpA family protein [Lewinellaceae bacterium]|nr:OmpA family protein [Lewinellaceae bacterium]
MRAFLVLLVAIFYFTPAWNQDPPIFLTNPSFEDFPAQGKPPKGWEDCGFPNETPPDVQPSVNPSYSYFEVVKPAYDGNTYLGMVVRDNDTWEMVSQRLSGPLKAGDCYEFSLFLCRSELYVSQSRVNFQNTNYTTPAKLRIWGGSSYCNKKELLAETSPIINTRWLKYDFKFKPKETHSYIVLEAFYNTPVLFPYNGNILVDNASPIVPVPCEDEVLEPVVLVPEQPKDPTTSPDSKTTPEKPAPDKSKTTEPANKILADLDAKNLRIGQTIQIENLYFEADSSKIKDESYPVLNEIYDFLDANPDVVVEIGGHTNGNPPHDYCDRLSTDRAKAVADFLAARGIPRNRIQYRGYGKRQPIASNATAEGRRRNQRVEIKILSVEG